MTKWRMLIEFEDVLSGAKLIEIEAETYEEGLEKLKGQTTFLKPENFYDWKKTDDFKTWKLQTALKSKNYLLNIFEDDFKVKDVVE